MLFKWIICWPLPAICHLANYCDIYYEMAPALVPSLSFHSYLSVSQFAKYRAINTPNYDVMRPLHSLTIIVNTIAGVI